MAYADALRQDVLETIAECRRGLEQGRADLSGLESGVRRYCKAVAALPKEEGRAHTQPLEDLMNEISSLEVELNKARDAVHRELEGLGRVKQANVAYQKSDAIGPVRRRKPEED